MLLFEFTVEGPPLSQQTMDRRRLRDWRDRVRAEAARQWPPGHTPYTDQLQLTVVYYHDGETIRMDNDNMVKPVQDALNGLVYVDDRQITDTRVRKTNLNGSFRVKGMALVLAEAFARGTEFLHIKVESAPDHRELL